LQSTQSEQEQDSETQISAQECHVILQEFDLFLFESVNYRKPKTFWKSCKAKVKTSVIGRKETGRISKVYDRETQELRKGLVRK
jgi:hypothetical protein